jgi:hypothetical protein
MRSSPHLAELATPLRLVEPSTDFDFEPDEEIEIEIAGASPAVPSEGARQSRTSPAQLAFVASLAAGFGFAVGRRISGGRAPLRRRPR